MRLASLGLSVLVAIGAGAPPAGAQADMLQAHIGHILESFKDTPKQQGLLPTALDEAKIAAEHAALGVQQHVELAAKVERASTTAKNQALYVSRWAGNVTKWSDEAIELAQEIRKTTRSAGSIRKAGSNRPRSAWN